MVDRVELAALISETLGRTIEAAEPSFDEWADADLFQSPFRSGNALCPCARALISSTVVSSNRVNKKTARLPPFDESSHRVIVYRSLFGSGREREFHQVPS
jgi:hypothetical protein